MFVCSSAAVRGSRTSCFFLTKLEKTTPDRRQGHQQVKSKTNESVPCIREYPRKPAEIRADPRKDAQYQRGPAEASRVSGGTRGTLQGFRRSPRNLAGYRMGDSAEGMSPVANVNMITPTTLRCVGSRFKMHPVLLLPSSRPPPFFFPHLKHNTSISS